MQASHAGGPDLVVVLALPERKHFDNIDFIKKQVVKSAT